jgi:hypothetical protein
MTRAGILLVMLAAMLTACVTTKHTLINPSAEQYPEVPPEAVRIIMSETELDTLEFVRIAIIEATGSGEFSDQTAMVEAMRKRAARLGANAILLPQIMEPGAGAKVAAAIFGTGTERKGSVVAIRVLGPKPRPDGDEPHPALTGVFRSLFSSLSTAFR